MRGKNRTKPRGRQAESSVHGHGHVLGKRRPIWHFSIPRLLCSKFAGIRFADAVEPALIADAVLCEY
jgi:hypothetical protein